MPGYRQERNVSPSSTTETFVALKLFIDNWRWAGVPFYLRSGKRLPKRVTEIAVHFKEAPHLLFGRRGESIRAQRAGDPHPARRGDRAQLRIQAARAGDGDRAREHGVPLRASFGVEPPEAYERLLLDCLLGDTTLFTRADEVEASWAWVSRIHRRWAEETAQAAATAAARCPPTPPAPGARPRRSG